MSADVPRAALIVAVIAVVVSALITLLPPPREVFASSAPVGISAQVDRGALIVATVLTWSLALWLTGVVLIVVVARIARGSRYAEQWVTRSAQVLLPRTLCGVVITAVGVGSLSAMAGCAPATSAASAPASTGVDRSVAMDSSVIPDSTAAALPQSWDWPTDAAPGASADPGPDAAGVSATAAAAPTTVSGSSGAPSAADQPVAPTTVAGPTGSPVTPTDGPADRGTGTAGTSTAPAADAASPPETTPGAAVITAPPVNAATPEVPAPTSVAPPAGSVPAVAPSEALAAGAETSPPPPAGVIVVAGDSLWSIAAAHLPADATDADIAAAWPRWFEANRGLIGADPGQIRPGWQLIVPSDSQDTRP